MMCGYGHDHRHKSNAQSEPANQPYLGRNYNGAWKKTPGRLFGTGFIRLYQLTLSGFIGNSCRHLPTCSEYTYESIARYGLWSGGWMGLFRVVRCGPFGTDGYDPVPQVMPQGYSWYKPWRYWLIARKTKS
ncbi:membrane protein insertion efficiency factor YidD [Brucellaceae bacterium C25G]